MWTQKTHRKNNFAETLSAEISSFLIRQGQCFQVSDGNFLSPISGGGQGVVYSPLWNMKCWELRCKVLSSAQWLSWDSHCFVAIASVVFLNVYLPYHLFGCTGSELRHAGSLSCCMWDLVYWPGRERGSLHGKRRDLATEPPGKSHGYY